MAIVYYLRSSHYDSILSRKPDLDSGTDLTVVLRILFRPRNPPPNQIPIDAGPNQPPRTVRILPWTTGQVWTYIKTFKERVEEAWSDWIYLLLPDPAKPAEAMNPRDYRTFLNPAVTGKQPFIRCMLQINLASVPEEHPHAILNLVNPAPGQRPVRAHVDMTQLNVPVNPPREGVVDRASVEVRHHGPDLHQVPVAHEVGHLLGLTEVNAKDPRCPGGTGHEICYWGDPLQKRDIMGRGEAVTPEHAAAWLHAIQRHTGHRQGWRATHVPPYLSILLEKASKVAP
jgi:hypothetical protein